MKYTLFLFISLNILLNAQWTSTNGPNSDTSIAEVTSIISTNNILFAGTNGSGLFKYIGNEWIPVKRAFSGKYITINSLAENNNVIYTGQQESYSEDNKDSTGIFLSTNFGDDWVNIGNGLPSDTRAETFTFTDSSIYLGCTYFSEGIEVENASIFRTFDGGKNWEHIYSELGTSRAKVLIVSPKYIIASTFNTIRSKPDTILWNNIEIFDYYTVTTIIRNGKYLYAGAHGGYDGDLFFSTDEGENWFIKNMKKDMSFLYSYKNYIFAAGEYSDMVYKSDDYGETWSLFNEGLPSTDDKPLVHRGFAVNGNYLYTATNRGVWRRPLSNVVPIELSSFTASVNQHVVTLNWRTASEKNNKGFEIQRKLPGKDWEVIEFIEGKGTVTTTSIYEFRDEFQDITFNGNVSYRLKQYDYNGTSELSKEVSVSFNNLPENYSLSQNYPNPFNPATVIRYSIPYESDIIFSIYNSLGQKVNQVYEGVKTSGNYELNVSSIDLSSGVYFYSMNANSTDGKNNFTAAKKMIIMK